MDYPSACIYDARGRIIVTFRNKLTKDGYLIDGGEFPEVAQIHLKDLRPYIRRLA